MRTLVLLIALAMTSGCRFKVELYCDEVTPCETLERPFCDLSGEFPASEGIGRTCIPNPFDASVPDGSPTVADGGGLDASFDAAPSRYEVAYCDEFTFSVDGPISGYLLFVNQTSQLVNINTLSLRQVIDDHPQGSVVVNASPSNAVLAPGQAAGDLGGIAEQLIIDSGLVTEARVDTIQSYLSLGLTNMPSGEYDVNVEVTIELEGVETRLPILIHHVNGPTVFADPVAASRIGSGS